MIKYTAKIIGLMIMASNVFAAQPVALLDNPAYEPIPAEVKQVFQNALECKTKLNIASPSVRRYLNQSEPDNWHLAIPVKAFGMEANDAVFYIDSSGDLGYSYSATYKESISIAKKNAAIPGEEIKSAAGVLSIESHANGAKITCTSN